MVILYKGAVVDSTRRLSQLELHGYGMLLKLVISNTILISYLSSNSLIESLVLGPPDTVTIRERPGHGLALENKEFLKDEINANGLYLRFGIEYREK